MFAFAVWDDANGRLLLARDRIGKKPLFYTIEDSCLYFASSLNALRETSEVHWEIDISSVDAYLTLGYIPAPRTIYSGVSKLEAGTLTTIGEEGIATRRYWDLAGEIEPVPQTMSAGSLMRCSHFSRFSTRQSHSGCKVMCHSGSFSAVEWTRASSPLWPRD